MAKGGSAESKSMVAEPKSTPEKLPTKKTAGEWRPAFLSALRNSANVRAACQAAGIDRKTAYKARDASSEFHKQWDEAMQDACDVLEAEAWKRARSNSDLLLIFLLKAHRPAMYRETVRQEHSGPGGGPIQIQPAYDLRRLTDEELATFEQLVGKAGSSHAALPEPPGD